MKNTKIKIFPILFIVFLIAGTAFIAFQQSNAPYRNYSGKVFGTYFNITYQSSEDLEKEMKAAMDKVDASLSMFNENSTISRINRGEDVQIDNLFAYIFPRAMKVSDITEGAFDITVAPLVNAWGFGFKQDKWPTDEEIDSLRAIVGYKTIHLNDRKITKDNPHTMIDLSAIAKGYGSDVVAQVLDKAKVQNYMVEIGGEVVMKGRNDKGDEWKIGIAEPTDDKEQTANTYSCVLQLTDKAVATSGNYRNFYYKDGVKYAHTIDPRTGRPVQQDIISATVLAPHCYEADAFATSFMVVGLDKAKEIISKQKQLEAYLIYIDKDGNKKVWYSEGMKSIIK